MIWRTLIAIDFDLWATETYRANFPAVDIRCSTVAAEIPTLPYADVILGGPPCQPFSDAGENEGEQDERDGWPDAVAAVHAVHPRMFLFENVRGLLKERHLPYFGRILSQLESAGYVVQYRVQDAVSFGVPQFRERVWTWGIRSDLYAAGIRHCWPKPTHAWPPPEPSMFGDELLPGVTVGQALARVRCEMTCKSFPIGKWETFSSRHPHAVLNDPSPTLMTDWISHQSVGLVEIPGTGMMRNYTPNEGARIQSMPHDFKWPSGIGSGRKTRIIGNGWACAHAAAFARALHQADPQAETVIDLFCGGGLGACGWHQRYWRYEPETDLDYREPVHPDPRRQAERDLAIYRRMQRVTSHVPDGGGVRPVDSGGPSDRRKR